ncbi:DUF4401 domain-containing protein [Pontibacter locisalis]|uniref:DUF4401 domain-containing protein n=1 Tax=Pontibacter locisalis TaxID=1719035 RepID=A0ABW5IJ56_9BACT
MANTDMQQLDTLLQKIEQEQEGFTYDRTAIEEEAAQGGSVLKKLPIKILTILGGFLATGTFMGFFLAAGIYESGVGLLFLGLCLLVGAELLIRAKMDSTSDSIGVSLNITGYVLFAMGTGLLTESTSAVAGALALASVLVAIISRSSICVFISILVLNGSFLALIFTNKLYDLSHALIAVLGVVLTYMSLSEPKLLAASPEKASLKYGPVRMGVIFSLVITLALFVHQKFLSTTIEHFWVSSLLLMGCLLLQVHHVVKDAAITAGKTKAVVYSCCILVLIPTVLTPSIPGALLILLTSFYIGHRPGFWVGLLALAYFVILYYYDLNMTLLAKSGVLVASGLLFLGSFVLLNKQLRSYAD